MIKIGKVYISLFLIGFFLVCTAFGALEFIVLSYLSLIIHEGFHLIFALKMKIKVSRIVFLPFGINIKINEKISPLYEILLCAAGPFGSGISAVIFLYLKYNGIYFLYSDYLILSNFSIFIINILPIYPLDGGRIFKCILENKTGYYKAVNISIWVSQLCVFIMCIFIFLAVLASKFNVSIMVLCCFLIYSLSLQKNEALLSFSKLLTCSKQKLENKGQLPVKEIVVTNNTVIREIFSYLSENMYIVITITTVDGKILSRLTETEFIERLINQKSVKTIGQIIFK